MWLEYLVETSVDLNICVFGVRAEAYVQDAAGTSSTAVANLDATTDKQVMVSSPGT